MDSTSKRWVVRSWQGKLSAGFANSGGLSRDKLAVLQHLCLFAMQHGMNWVGLPLVPTEQRAGFKSSVWLFGAHDSICGRITRDNTMSRRHTDGSLVWRTFGKDNFKIYQIIKLKKSPSWAF